jgi:hypothetical protein
MCYGWHGGYYLDDAPAYRELMGRLLALFEGAPVCRGAFEIEPYTLERMSRGASFAVERLRSASTLPYPWTGGGPGATSLTFGPEWRRGWSPKPSSGGRAQAGRARGVRLGLRDGAWANLCQPLPATGLGGVRLRFSVWVRVWVGLADLYIDAHRDGNLLQGSGKSVQTAQTEGVWRFLSMEYDVPQTAGTIFPQCRLIGAPGDAEFDGPSLVRLDTGRELLENRWLEQGPPITLKDEAQLARLRRIVASGRIEIVGGAYTQPILYTIGQESVVQQFVLGCRAVEEAVGAGVRVYAAQEPAWIGQLPQLLQQMGFSGVVYRTSWQAFGAAPARNDEAVAWIGPDGTRIAATPMPEAMRAGWGLANPSPEIVRSLAAAGVERPLFLAFADFVPEALFDANDPRAAGHLASGLANWCRATPAGSAAGQEVEISAWLRARTPGAHLYIDAYQGVANLGGTETATVPPDGRWHRCSARFNVPAQAERLYPQARIYVSTEAGDADISGISLRIVSTGAELLPDVGLKEDPAQHGWTGGGMSGAEAGWKIGGEGAPDGGRFVNLHFRCPPLRADLVTPSAYLRAIGPPASEWRDAYAGFEHRFPWGVMGGRNLRANREMERRLLGFLRLQAMAGASSGPDRDELWRLVLIGQHHDAWVCGPLPPFGVWSRSGLERFADLTTACLRELMARVGTDRMPAHSDRAVVHNMAGVARRQVRWMAWRVPAGHFRHPVVVDEAGAEVPCDVQLFPRFPDGSALEYRGRALADIPALSAKTYQLAESRGKARPLPSVRVVEQDGGLLADAGTHGVWLGPEGLRLFRGGSPVLGAPAHVAGDFAGGPERSVFEKPSAQRPAGAVYLVAHGSIGPVRLMLQVRIDAVCPVIATTLTCVFGEGVMVGGGPAQMPYRAEWSIEERKLRWEFPLAWRDPEFAAHGAFELRKPSRPWWPVLDAAIAQGPEGGLALYPDRATSGLFRADPASLGVVLAFGGEFIYGSGGQSPLKGSEMYNLGMYAYAGSAERGMAVQMAELAEPDVTELIGTAIPPVRRSPLASVTPAHAAAISTVYADEGDLVIRLWRPYPGPAQAKITVPGAKGLWRANPGGVAKERLADGSSVQITLRSHEILTVRASRPAAVRPAAVRASRPA